MANPFLRRATEYVRDDASFMAIVSPAPLTTFLAKHPNKDELFELPVLIIGEPGSGKTMLARLAEFKMVEAILRDLSNKTNRELAAALADAGFLSDAKPKIAAVRVPMESDYRDFWELPYDDKVKTKLALWLIQARTMLALLRNLTANKARKLSDINFVARDATEAQLGQIGGLTGEGIRKHALEVQKAIYSVAAGLRPPTLDKLPDAATEPYEPFDAISGVEIPWGDEIRQLNPVVMLDDVHALHPDQSAAIFSSLARREIRFGRWCMMRLDALSPGAVLGAPQSQESHNLKLGRDFIDVRMQDWSGSRGTERKQFRSIALDMANRYLPHVQVLKNRNATDFSALLRTEAPSISASSLKDLTAKVDREQKTLEVTDRRREELANMAKEYLANASSYDRGREVELAMTRILMHRYANRVHNMMQSLFDVFDPEPFDPEPTVPIKVDSQVAEGARLHLHHLYSRPMHYGFEDLCDASNENAEVFLQFSGALVARMETLAIRNQSPALKARAQQDTLSEKAKAIMKLWSFAFAGSVRKLVDAIATECLKISMTPNARLGDGANAIGVPEFEMSAMLEKEEDVAVVLKHALANGAITVRRDYGQGGKNWCLIELSGTVCLAHGLTFKRGGFVEKRIPFLKEAMS